MSKTTVRGEQITDGSVDLTVDIKGVLPVANGGTGSSTGPDPSAATHASTSKSTPDDADEIPVADSASSWVLKKFTWANIKAAIAAYMVTLSLKFAQGTSIELHNQTDQVTNFERLRAFWSGNIANILTENGGTGTPRNLRLGTSNGSRFLDIADGASASGFYRLGTSTTAANANGLVVSGANWGASSGINGIVVIQPTFTQSGTAGYAALLVNPTETSTGSGLKSLLDLQIGGVSKFRVSNTGVVSNATFNDPSNAFFIEEDKLTLYDASDTSKGFQLAVPSGQTTGTVRTHTLPATSSTLASLDGAETLSSKKLKTYTVQTVAGGTVTTSYSPNLSNGNIFDITLTSGQQCAITMPSASGNDGASFRLRVKQCASGTAGTIVFTGGTAPTWTWEGAPSQTATNGAVDFYDFDCNGSIWRGVQSAAGFAA